MNEQTKERGLSFWDIESKINIFMFAIYHPGNIPENESLAFFYLYDDVYDLSDQLKDKITKYVFKMNPELSSCAKISFYNMKDENVNRLLLQMFCVDNKPAFGRPIDNKFRLVNPELHSDLDEDLSWDYMIGWNSTNYDDTMMAFYFNETWGFDGFEATFMPTTAEFMRKFNNLLFQKFKENMPSALQNSENDIYQNMLRSGMFLDASRINDKVYKMALKRVEGMLGLNIYENDDVSNDEPIKTEEELLNLFAYNASDVIKTGIVFSHSAFKAQFDLKKGLLESYPDIIYDKEGKVRINRLKVDSTSANFAAKSLCPDGYLKDTRAVTFEYPRGSGRNILQETRLWAAEKFKDHPEIMEKYLNPIFDYYGQIEGKNFDDSDHYTATYNFDALPVSNIKAIPMPQTAIPYFDKDGNFTRTYVNFGIGGIHGAEYNMDLYLADLDEYNAAYKKIEDFVSMFTEDELKGLKSSVSVNGVTYKVSQYITKKKTGEIKIKYPKPVQLFKMTPSGNWQLNKRYAYCSDDEVDHEDFTSYYPCMLMNLQAFVNEMLGKDRYKEQFNNKTLFGKYMKDQNRPKSERTYYKIRREGTKLILNSASGAADTTYDTNIRMNNVIIAMRIIGQLFTWRIGQAQTLEGFKITSTNTDGLYAVCNDSTRELCREILKKESESIGVDIEPEEMRLISKDANNRIEVSLDGKILSASGGDTACFEGPNPVKALAHPAIIDTLIVKYLVKYGPNEKFDYDKAMIILNEIKQENTPKQLLMLYQNMINSSEGTCRYVFARVDNEIRKLQHNNRIFAVTQEAAHIYMANGWNKGVGHDKTADEVLKMYGVDPSIYTNTRVIKVSKIDPEQNMFIFNQAYDSLSEETQKNFIANLDDGFYIELMKKTFANWCNAEESSDDEDSDE